MSIKPVDFGGMLQRSQDVSSVKQQQDQRPVVEQQQIGHREEEKISQRMRQVNQADKKNEMQSKYDARDEGKNKYFFNGKQGKKKKEEADKVVRKEPSSGFDIKI